MMEDNIHHLARDMKSLFCEQFHLFYSIENLKLKKKLFFQVFFLSIESYVFLCGFGVFIYFSLMVGAKKD